MSTQHYPLFPLSSHLLPEGVMTLRIFEPRYKRMVKHACAENTGFVMCMLDARGDADANQHIHPIGTFAKVIDFDLLDDGLLGIKVAGSHLVEVKDIVSEADGLRVGRCSPFASWSCDNEPLHIAPIDERLREVFRNYEELAALYDTPRFDDAIWVLQRWLELLPIDSVQKQQFLRHKDHRALLNFLNALVP